VCEWDSNATIEYIWIGIIVGVIFICFGFVGCLYLRKSQARARGNAARQAFLSQPIPEDV